jgi:hypothetical protein
MKFSKSAKSADFSFMVVGDSRCRLLRCSTASSRASSRSVSSFAGGCWLKGTWPAASHACTSGGSESMSPITRSGRRSSRLRYLLPPSAAHTAVAWVRYGRIHSTSSISPLAKINSGIRFLQNRPNLTGLSGPNKKATLIRMAYQTQKSQFLRRHYPDQVRRSVTKRSPSQPGFPSSLCCIKLLHTKLLYLKST